jgi:hypothetical protein
MLHDVVCLLCSSPPLSAHLTVTVTQPADGFSSQAALCDCGSHWCREPQKCDLGLQFSFYMGIFIYISP